LANWDERYKKGEHSSLAPHPLLIRFAENAAPGSALDLACGAGRHALFLAERGWRVTAVDASPVAIQIMLDHARERGLTISAHAADLERGGFVIEPEHYDLICDFYYLQRDLFSAIRAGVKTGGAFVAAIHLASEDPAKDAGRNPSFLLKAGELRSYFEGWRILHYHEASMANDNASDPLRRYAEIIATPSRTIYPA
jgi:SAM-dependent methyltransferase